MGVVSAHLDTTNDRHLWVGDAGIFTILLQKLSASVYGADVFGSKPALTVIVHQTLEGAIEVLAPLNNVSQRTLFFLSGVGRHMWTHIKTPVSLLQRPYP